MTVRLVTEFARKILEHNTEEADILTASSTTLVQRLFEQVFLPELQKVKSRIVGQALSEAKPGKEFDIKLGSYCI